MNLRVGTIHAAWLIVVFIFASELQSAAGATKCKTDDLRCFSVAAQNCSPSTVTWTKKVDSDRELKKVSQVLLVVDGLAADGKCVFSIRTDKITLSLTAEAEQQAKAKGWTAKRIQQLVGTMQAGTKKLVGQKFLCGFATSDLSQLLINWSKGIADSKDLDPGSCIGSPATVSLREGFDSTFNGLGFKVSSLSSKKINFTFTDQKRGKSQTATLVPKTSKVILGREMRVATIERVKTGSTGGQPDFALQATLLYEVKYGDPTFFKAKSN